MKVHSTLPWIVLWAVAWAAAAEAQGSAALDTSSLPSSTPSGSEQISSTEAPAPLVEDSAEATALRADIKAADLRLAAGKPDEALSTYMLALDAASALRSRVALEAGARVDEVLREVPNMPQEQLDAVEASLPTWESLETDHGRGALMRFVDTRRKRYVQEGDSANAEATAHVSRDMAWALIGSNSSVSVIRAAVKIYRYATETLGQAPKGRQDLQAHADTLPPSPAKFCIEYWAAQDDAKAGDAGALAQHCRTLLDIHEQGALKSALDDPFGGASDKLLMEYHIAYAQFVLGRLDEARRQCDHVLEVYADVIDHRREEHGALAMTALLRAMTLAAQAKEPATALEAYDVFLTRYPNRPQVATAWLQKGVVYADQGNVGQALACFDEAIARATHPDVADVASEAKARRVELTAKPAP